MIEFIHEYHLVMTIAAWVLGLTIGLVIVLIWRKGMNTARLKTNAATYVVPNSLNFKLKKDSFLYSNVIKTKLPSQSSSKRR